MSTPTSPISEVRPIRPKPIIFIDPNVSVDRIISTPAGARLSTVLKVGTPGPIGHSVILRDQTSSSTSPFPTPKPIPDSNPVSTTNPDQPNTPVFAAVADTSLVSVNSPNSSMGMESYVSAKSPKEATFVSSKQAEVEGIRRGSLFIPSAAIAGAATAASVPLVEDQTIWSDAGSIQPPKRPFIVAARNRWDRTSPQRKICVFLAIGLALLVIAVALGVGIGVGTSKKGVSNASSQGASTDLNSDTPTGTSTGTTTGTTTGTASSSTPSNSPDDKITTTSNQTSIIPNLAGKYSFITFLDTVQTDCVADSKLWTCAPETEYGISASTSYAVFNWQIEAAGANYTITAISATSATGTTGGSIPADGLSFYKIPLALLDQGTEDERFYFQVSFEKTVFPYSVLATTSASRSRHRRRDGGTTTISNPTCVFTTTTFQASIFTKQTRTYPNSQTRPISASLIPYSQWNTSISIEEIAAAESFLTSSSGDTVPICYADAAKRNQVTLASSELTAQNPSDPAVLCSCLYNNRKV